MGDQFQVNSYTNNWQDDPDVLPLRNGGFIVTWSSYFNEYDDGLEAYYIAAQRYDAAGDRVGGEFILDVVDGAASTVPAIAPLPDGGYALAFSYSAEGILGQTQTWTGAFDLDGTARGPQSQADGATSDALFESALPAVEATSDGYMVFFMGDRTESSRFDEVYYRRYEADGTPIGRTRLLNTEEHYLDQGNVVATTLANGRVVAVWNSEATDPGKPETEVRDNELRASIFASDGTVIDGDFRLVRNIGYAGTDTGRSDFDIAPTTSGFVVSQLNWGSRLGTEQLFHITMQTFDARGGATSDIVTVHRTDESVYDTRVTTLESGEVVVVWQQRPENGDVGMDVLARVMTETGRPISDVFEVGVDFDPYDDQEAPVARGLAGGGFVVAYSHENLDGDSRGIAARIFGRATAEDDRIDVDASGSMAGLGGDDRIFGDDRPNLLLGGRGNDRLYGGAGADTLIGGPGADRMWGGAGPDDFVFDTLGARDRIYRFRDGDEILLDNDALVGIGRVGDLAAKRFAVLGEDRVTADTRILYDPDRNVLSYDPDGSGPEAAHALVRLYQSQELTLDDLRII